MSRRHEGSGDAYGGDSDDAATQEFGPPAGTPGVSEVGCGGPDAETQAGRENATEPHNFELLAADGLFALNEPVQMIQSHRLCFLYKGYVYAAMGREHDRTAGNAPRSMAEDPDDWPTIPGIIQDREGNAYVRQCRLRSLTPVRAKRGAEVLENDHTAEPWDERTLPTNGGRWVRTYITDIEDYAPPRQPGEDQCRRRCRHSNCRNRCRGSCQVQHFLCACDEHADFRGWASLKRRRE